MSDEILKVLLSILAAVLSGGIGILTIYLKSKWTAENFQRVLGIVDEMVRAAEIVGAAAGWDGEAKKQQAINWVAERTGLPESEIVNYVEAAVARLKSAGEELTKSKAGAVVVKD